MGIDELFEDDADTLADTGTLLEDDELEDELEEFEDDDAGTLLEDDEELEELEADDDVNALANIDELLEDDASTRGEDSGVLYGDESSSTTSVPQ